MKDYGEVAADILQMLVCDVSDGQSQKMVIILATLLYILERQL